MEVQKINLISEYHEHLYGEVIKLITFFKQLEIEKFSEQELDSICQIDGAEEIWAQKYFYSPFYSFHERWLHRTPRVLKNVPKKINNKYRTFMDGKKIRCIKIYNDRNDPDFYYRYIYEDEYIKRETYSFKKWRGFELAGISQYFFYNDDITYTIGISPIRITVSEYKYANELLEMVTTRLFNLSNQKKFREVSYKLNYNSAGELEKIATPDEKSILFEDGEKTVDK